MMITMYQKYDYHEYGGAPLLGVTAQRLFVTVRARPGLLRTRLTHHANFIKWESTKKLENILHNEQLRASMNKSKENCESFAFGL